MRVWWSPSGALSSASHAAGHHSDSTRTALDRVVSSYAPTVRALQSARSREKAVSERHMVGAPEGDLLAVVPGYSPGVPALPGAEREVDAVRSLVPTGVLA